jgi:gas vesicle protein
MMEIAMMAGLAIGVVLGGVIGYLVATLKKKEAGQSVENINTELRAEQDRNEILSEDFKDLNQQLREEREKYLSLSN